MDNVKEKVCTRCATLNDPRSLVCVRCGNNLDEEGTTKYDILIDRMMSSIFFVMLFSIVFGLCSYGVVYYVGPWIYGKLSMLGQTFIADFYNNPNLIDVLIELMFTVSISFINYILVVLILEITIGSKLIKKDKANLTTLTIYISTLLILGGLIIKKYDTYDIALIEYLFSVIIVFPYVKKKILRRSA